MLEHSVKAVDYESVVEEGLEVDFALTEFYSPLVVELLRPVVVAESLLDKGLRECGAELGVKLKKSCGHRLYSHVGVVMLTNELESLFANLGYSLKKLHFIGVIINAYFGVPASSTTTSSSIRLTA